MTDKPCHRVLRLYETFQNNIVEDRAFLISCRDIDQLDKLEAQISKTLKAMDELKGFVRMSK